MTQRPDELFSERWSPTKVSFWCVQSHWDALALGMAPDEAVALQYEWQVVQAGFRDVLGQPCACHAVEHWPEALRGRTGTHGDSAASLIGLKCDLERATNRLPLPWSATQRIWTVQGRSHAWKHHMRLYLDGGARKGLDDWPEPLDPETRAPRSRQLAYACMASTLGWSGTCRWPGRQTPIHGLALAA